MARPTVLFVVSLVLYLSVHIVSGNLSQDVTTRSPPGPKPSPHCSASRAFCSSGVPTGIPPAPPLIDIISVFLLHIPSWDLGSDCKGMHCLVMRPTLGFTSTLTNRSYTLAWYPQFGLWNSIVPRVPKKKNSAPLWCNQGAVCVSQTAGGWRKSRITQITGSAFKQLMQWTQTVNNSNVDFGTLTVRRRPVLNASTWFPINDSANFVQRACQQMARLGAFFDAGEKLRVTRAAIFSEKPRFLGKASKIFGPKGQPALAEKIRRFYRNFQPNQSAWQMLLSSLDVLGDLLLTRRLYFYHEGSYWLLPLEPPFVGLITDSLSLSNQTK